MYTKVNSRYVCFVYFLLAAVCRGRQKSAYGFKWKYDKGNEIGETWRDIPNLNGYQASSEGNIRNAQKLITQSTNDKGYKHVGINGKHYRVNRLVALAFIPTDDTSLEVDHIDAVRDNNNVTNLRWLSHQGNVEHTQSVAVKQLDMDDNLIAIYKSMRYASEATELSKTNIHNACTGVQKTSGGFKWEYVNERPKKERARCITMMKAIEQLDKKGIVIKQFPSIEDASKECGSFTSSISAAIKRKGTCGGFKWRYAAAIL